MKKSISPRSLNTDDNKLALGPQESTFSLNIDAEGFGEDEAGVVKHVRGNLPTSRSDEGVVLPFGDNKILGSISDDQLNVVYFFVHNSEGQHSVLAYSSTTNTYRTVFVSPALDFSEDSFVKADIVRLRRTPEDQELIVEPPVPPATFTPVELRFFVGIDFSVWGEKNGYKSSDPAPAIIGATQVIFTPQNGLRLYDGGGIITEDTPTIGNFQEEFKDNVTQFDGWVKYGTFVLHVHPEDIQNASKFLKYRIANSLGGPAPTASDVFRTISNSTMIQASDTSANGLQLGRPCYGFNKPIEEILVDDIFATSFSPLKSLMNSSTSSGLLLDRKLNFKASCNYSETPEWGSALIAAVNDYEGGPFTSGSQGERSHPAERMDNGGEGPGVGPGGGGGGLELVTITYCTNENWQTIGAAYPSISEAVAAAFTYDPQEYIVTIENLCPVSGTSTTFEPTMWIYDSRSTEYESFPSENAVVFDVDLQTIPSNYSFTGKFNLSSCGTMRTQSGFIFGGPGGASTTEIPPTFVPSPLGLYWAPQNGQGTNGYEFGDRISDISTGDAPNLDLDGGELQQDTRFRSFEVSVNPGDGQVSIFNGGQALDLAGVVWYESAAGSGQPTSSTNLCYGTHSACGLNLILENDPRRIDLTVTGDEVETSEGPATTGGETPSVDTTTDTTTTTTTTTTTRDVTQRDSTLTRDIPDKLSDTSISKEKTKTAKGK